MAELAELLMQERAEVDQHWADMRSMFFTHALQIIGVWTTLSDLPPREAIDQLDDDEVAMVCALAMLSMKEILQQAGATVVERQQRAGDNEV